MDRLLIVGLDEPEYLALKGRISCPITWYDMLPRVQVMRGQLYAERPNSLGQFVRVSRVIFHGIFEDDLPLLTALALWGGPCLPNAGGMMDCRQRIPCLVRALRVTRFGEMLRGYADSNATFVAETETVAKWGEWHCGENKEKITGNFTAPVPTLFEPYIMGQAVRVHLLGERAWQIRLAGEDWKKSIHHADAGFVPVDPELLEDSRALQKHFGLEMLAMDYIIGDDGQKYLLEVNHIPNVTLFPELREAYLDFAAEWVNKPLEK